MFASPRRSQRDPAIQPRSFPARRLSPAQLIQSHLNSTHLISFHLVPARARLNHTSRVCLDPRQHEAAQLAAQSSPREKTAFKRPHLLPAPFERPNC